MRALWGMLLALAAFAAAATETGERTRGRCHFEGEPLYPLLLREHGNRGVVTMRFYINPRGEVENPEAIASTHPLFERSAVDWLLHQKPCTPWTKDGVPVGNWVSQTYTFALRSSGSTARSGVDMDVGEQTFTIGAATKPGLPEEWRYDTPPEVQYVAPLVYPLPLLLAETSGSARVLFVVDQDGRVRYARVLESTQPEFGFALKASLESWRFRPAMRKGKPCLASLQIEQRFNSRNRETWTDRPTDNLLDRIRDGKEPFAGLAKLDRRPRALVHPNPVFPPDRQREGGAGSALIEFIIGADGVARLPSIVSADDPSLGWAAATAIARWRFEPPTQEGKPVEVRARIPMEFKLPEGEAFQLPPGGLPDQPPKP